MALPTISWLEEQFIELEYLGASESSGSPRHDRIFALAPCARIDGVDVAATNAAVSNGDFNVILSPSLWLVLDDFECILDRRLL